MRLLKITLLLLLTLRVSAQSTINPNDLSTILLGGAQESGPLGVQLQQIALVDLEPDQIQFVNLGGVGTILEAGVAPSSGSGNANENTQFWINLSCRNESGRPATLSVGSNQKLTGNMKLYVEVIQVNIAGEMKGTPITGQIEINPGDKALITNISPGYTGDGQGIGYQLRYTLLNPQNKSFPQGYEVFFTLNLN